MGLVSGTSSGISAASSFLSAMGGRDDEEDGAAAGDVVDAVVVSDVVGKGVRMRDSTTKSSETPATRPCV
jgi:hypothetical protein